MTFNLHLLMPYVCLCIRRRRVCCSCGGWRFRGETVLLMLAYAAGDGATVLRAGFCDLKHVAFLCVGRSGTCSSFAVASCALESVNLLWW